MSGKDPHDRVVFGGIVLANRLFHEGALNLVGVLLGQDNRSLVAASLSQVELESEEINRPDIE